MTNEFKAKNGLITPVVTSTVATGTAPLVVSSTTPVANLSIEGNARTATKLATARTINGILFDGTSNISIGVIGKNYLHNSNFAINQLNLTGTVTLAANSKDAHDRFRAGAGGCTYTFAYSLGKTTITITAGTLIQVVNGLDLASGTNMYCLSWGGTATGKIGTGIAGASGVIGSLAGGNNYEITFSTGTLWEVKLEKGSTPTAYEQPNLTEEWANCLLYFEYINGAQNTVVYSGVANGIINTFITVSFARKISVPTVSMSTNWNVYSVYNAATIGCAYQAAQSCLFSTKLTISHAASFSAGAFILMMNSAVSSYLKIDARL